MKEENFERRGNCKEIILSAAGPVWLDPSLQAAACVMLCRHSDCGWRGGRNDPIPHTPPGPAGCLQAGEADALF